MKNKGKISFLMVIMMVFNLSIITSGVVLGASMDGAGTEQSPYLIRTVKDLYSIPNNPTAQYKMMNDLKLQNINRVPIPKFMGVLDGNGYAISNLRVVSTTNAGLFIELDGANIRNLILDSSMIISNGSVGAIASYCSDTTLENCTVSNTEIKTSNVNGGVGSICGRFYNGSAKNCYSENNFMYGEANVGGVFGSVKNSIITDSYSIGGSVVSSSVETLASTGGFIGHAVDSTIKRSYTTTDVSANSTNVGGFIGYALTNLKISECFATNSVKGQSCVGGLIGVGYQPSGTSYRALFVIEDSYFRGTVTAIKSSMHLSTAGGLSTYGDIVVKNCYSASTITAPDSVWAIAFSDSITNSFFNKDISNISTPIHQARTTNEMYQKSNYKNWDFENVWTIDDGRDYPKLRFELEINKPIEIPVKSVSIYPTQAEIIMGESLCISSFVTPNDATNQNVTWVSTNPNSFTVDENGIVFPVNLGHGSVICITEDGRHIAYCNISVKEELPEVPPQNLALQSTITTNNTQKDVANINDEDLTTKWVAKGGVTGNVSIRLDLEQSAEVNQVVVSEGGHVNNYILQYLDNGSWKDIQAGSLLGVESIINFPAKEISSLRLVMKGYTAPPEIYEFEVYKR